MATEFPLELQEPEELPELEEALRYWESRSDPNISHDHPKPDPVKPRHPPRRRKTIKYLLLTVFLCAAAAAGWYFTRPQPEHIDAVPVTADARIHSVTFRADGEDIATRFYTDETCSEPPVPKKQGYAGAWEDYALVGDVVVEAVYTYKEWNGVVPTESLPVHKKPDASSKTVKTLTLGDMVRITGETAVDGELWCQTESGWLQKSALVRSTAKGAEIADIRGIETTGDWTIRAETAAALISALEQVGHDAAFHLVDLETGYSISCNPDTEFYCASTIKGPYVCSILNRYPEAVDEMGDTMQSVVEYSSNSGFNNLRNRYGVSCLTAWCQEAGVELNLSIKWPPITAEELCKLWMQNAEFFESGAVGETAAAWFEQPERSPIRTALGETYVTRSKAGWVSDETDYHQSAHDAGVIYTERGNYAVAILTTAPADLTVVEPIAAALDLAHQDMCKES